MQLCRFYLPNQGAHLGYREGQTVYDLTASGQPQFVGLTELLQATTATPLPTLLSSAAAAALPSYDYTALDRSPTPDAPHLLPPVDQQEVWAAGVTYAWSREARVREAISKDIYVRVYDAERPELFFKSMGEKVVGPNDWIGLRADSHWNVPEPELALVLNPRMEIVGYTIGNDVSSRDIEGENPLYLPQAKIFRHACALGPLITVADQPISAAELAIKLVIHRSSATVFEGETSTTQLRRQLPDLAAYLARDNDFPKGAVLLTGTGIVPPDDWTLQDGDEVLIEIEAIGTLRNIAKQM